LPKQGNIIRPLLFARKSLLYAFADHYQLSFREDSSNASDKYTRNYFRHHLLPVVQKVFAQAEENLAKNIVRFREAEQLYFQAIDQHKKKLMEKRGHEMFIPVLKLKKTKPLETVTYEIIKEFGFSARQSQEVIGLLDSETSKYVQSSLFRIIKSRNWLIISPIKTELSQTIVIEGSAGKFPFENGTLELKEQPVINFQPSSLPLTAQLDALSISFPLILRKRKQGDYFYPLGMKKKKKLNRFMSDNKISVTEKENTWVLEMNKKIIWVVGHRIDDRFKITGNTSKMLQVKFIPTGS
ncbi:MAG: tRNA lysidine(34) synthetase TilS, partial [Chitinophagaceae bacterium]